jgi:hypothetical protein
MTPKEKAQYLVESMTFTCRECDNAKLAALIAVEEIINTGPLKMIDWGEIISDKPYWIEVKQEIEKL